MPRGNRATTGLISLDQFYKIIQRTAKSSYAEYLLSDISLLRNDAVNSKNFQI